MKVPLKAMLSLEISLLWCHHARCLGLPSGTEASASLTDTAALLHAGDENGGSGEAPTNRIIANQLPRQP